MMASESTNRKIEDIFNCCLCLEPYDTTINIPKALPCARTFSVLCLDKIIQLACDNDQNPNCPKCKVEFSIPQEGARKLPTNFAIQDMIELNMNKEIQPELCAENKPKRETAEQSVERKPEKEKKIQTCKSHPDRDLIMVCVTCEVGLCTDCMKTLGQSKHSDHNLEDFEAYLSAYNKALAELVKLSNQLPKLYSQAVKDADKNLADTKRERGKGY